MGKKGSRYICQQCGSAFPKWSGKCDSCGAWNSMVEQIVESVGSSAVAKSTGKKIVSQQISDISTDSKSERLVSGFSELDAVLGGGFMPGGVVLIAGQPGIGKSTLLLQVAHLISKKSPVLYISGEESTSQVRSRAERLGAEKSDMLRLASSTSADDVAETIRANEHSLVIVDSMQTMSLAALSSAPGSVSQITNASNVIIRAAKDSGTAVILVGHVTKEGSIAGPKLIEHLVDVVLQFEGDRYGGFKIIRAAKNRYGSTNEAALFEMSDDGLKSVLNPSAALLAERKNSDGSVVMATLEGNRPLLVEIQALVTKSHFGYPKRTASGFDMTRLNILIAVLERRTKLSLSDSDIYINIVGGLKLQDPAADLAVAMAIASAAAGKKLSDEAVVFGEVGLGGEIRSAQNVDKRISEAKKLGFTFAIAPATKQKNAFIKPVSDLRQVLIDYLKS